MASNPLEAEATGQEFIEATFSGNTFRLPLDVDSWPLDTIRRCRGVHRKTGDLAVDYQQLVIALGLLLGDQWPAFLEAAPKRKQWIPASHAFAAAVGIPATAGADLVFGSVPRLLTVLELWPEKVESDLDKIWGIDYRDRWLFQAGRRRLTLRQIHVRLSNLPTDSAVAIAMNGGKLHKTGTELLLMDLYQHGVGTGRRHPSRPMTAAQQAEADAQASAAAEQAERIEQDRVKYRAKHSKPSPQNALQTARANARREQERDAHAHQDEV